MITGLDSYIEATRRSLPHRLNPRIYESLFKVGVGIIDQHQLKVRMSLVYTSERRTETLRIDDDTVILYDQYLGQTLSSLSRIVHDEAAAKNCVNYVSKLVAEFFRAYGCAREAFVFARIHSFKENQLANAQTDPRRVLKVLFQEQFLFLHELFHVGVDQSPRMRADAEDMINEYFCDREQVYSNLRGKDLSQAISDRFGSDDSIPSDFLEDAAGTQLNIDYPTKAEMSIATLDEMACDYLAFVVVTSFADQQASEGGVDMARESAMSCLEALKNIYVINSLRESVRTYARGGKGESPASQYQRREDVARSHFVEWLISVIFGGRDGWEEGRITVDDYYCRYHDKLATISTNISEAICDRSVEELFPEVFEFVDNYVEARGLSFIERNAVVDIITGWHTMLDNVGQGRKSPASVSNFIELFAT